MEQKIDVETWLNVTTWLRMDEEKWQATIDKIAAERGLPPEKVAEVLDLLHAELARMKQAN
jgi:hypothetical protein